MDIKTVRELLKTEMKDVPSLWGDLLLERSRIALVAKPKLAKSFFVMQLGMCIAAGEDFLGMETIKSKVLYVNFELSEGKLQERLQDMASETKISDVSNFATVTPGERISLDTENGYRTFDDLMLDAGVNWGQTDLVILDPRSHSIEKDENQAEIMGVWCANIDRLRKEYGFTTLIVHHEGKSTTGSGRGSSFFDGWLDGTWFLKRSGAQSTDDDVPTTLTKAKLGVQSRDTESRNLALEFKYPKWSLSTEQFKKEKSKVEGCIGFIIDQLEIKPIWELHLMRTLAFRERHTDYAFKKAMKRLAADELVRVVKDSSKQGNYRLVEKATP